jgi:galactose mutarotase-like enzyme
MRLVRLRSGELEAAFAPEAGMVGCSLTHRGEELLGQRKGLEEYARSGSTFGIPFLHPWANRLSAFGYAVGGQEVALDRDSPLLRIEEHGLPIHGLRADGLAWEVDLPVERRLLLDENLVPTGAGETPAFRHGVLEDRALDDAYELPERPRPFTASAAGRTVGVEFLEGYTHGQAFAPAGQELICFEPMTAPANALISHDGLRLAPPGEPFTAAFRIFVDG